MVVLYPFITLHRDSPPKTPGAGAKVTGGTLVAIEDDGSDIPYERLNTLIPSPASIVLVKKFSEIIFIQPPSHPAYGTSAGKLSTQPLTPEAGRPVLYQTVETPYACPLHKKYRANHYLHANPGLQPSVTYRGNRRS
jgi:hypothetical protein